MKFRRTILAVSISAAIATLTACGGGGGGGGGLSATLGAGVRNDVPYYTPVRVDSFAPLNTAGSNYATSEMYVTNLSGATEQEIVVAGRMTPTGNNADWKDYRLNIYGWSNGTLVNRTSQWFSGTDNVIMGTEPSVKFADLNNDGRLDMYVAPNSDTSVYGPGAVFINNGTSFTRTNLNLGNIMGHDSAIYDFNGDGYKDIFTLNFDPTSRLSFGSANGTFTTYANITSWGGGAGVAVADFLGNGSATLIITDTGDGTNKLFSWQLSNALGPTNLYLAPIATLPTSRFLLPKWAGYNFTGTHDVRALAFDFDNSGRVGAVIFSRPWLTNGTWPGYSEVQFLKNHGGGVFTDVTDTTLIGYNTAVVPVSYNPYLMDINGDGLTDIVLGGGNNAAVLIHTREHKYVTSYATVLNAFQEQAGDMERLRSTVLGTGDNNIVFVQGPGGIMYLATTVTYYENNNIRKAVYLSKLGNNAVSAEATAQTVRQTWPWMSDAQVNQILSTSSTTWFGLNVLDPQRALQPIGQLSIPLGDQLRTLQGSLGGINLGSAANSVRVLDSIGRDFVINYSGTAQLGRNSWTRMIDAIDDDTRGSQLTGMEYYRFQGFKFGSTPDNKNIALGVTGIDIGKNLQLSAQYTRMPFSPYVQMTGSWGEVRSSDTIETTVSHQRNGWTSKFGVMYSGTDINPGLVTRINPITSVWGETGYQWTNLQLYTGILPKVVAGSADITLPTGIDNQGRIQYTNTRADVYGPTVHYARFSYKEKLTKNTSIRFNGMITSQGHGTVISEYRINF